MRQWPSLKKKYDCIAMSYPSFFLFTILCLLACRHGDEVSTQELKINWIDRGKGDKIVPGDFVLFTSTALGK